MRTAVCLTTLVFSSSVMAECFEAANIKGVTMANADHYQVAEDSFGERTLRITIDGDKASVAPDGFPDCSVLLETTVFCIGGAQGMPGLTTEQYTIEKASSRLILTQTRTGFVTPFEGFNGGKVMIGDIVGDCTE